MEKPETLFSRRLHKLLGPQVYHEKMSNPWRSGTPDFYYEGSEGILWSEHKWIAAPWKADRTAAELCSTKAWKAQLRWLQRASRNGTQVAVIIGVGTKHAYIAEPSSDFAVDHAALLTLEQVAKFINRKVVTP